jgi:hypothetical protein
MRLRVSWFSRDLSFGLEAVIVPVGLLGTARLPVPR